MTTPLAAPPDRSDQLIQVTRPWTWVALAGLSLVIITLSVWSVVGTVTDTMEVPGVLMRRGGIKSLKAPVGVDEKKGIVRRFTVVSGQRVRKDEVLAEVEVGGAGRKVACPVDDAVILRRVAAEGMEVGRDDALLLYEDRNEPFQVLLYPPTASGYRIEPGMDVHVTPANAKQIESGYLVGRVVSAGRYPVSPTDLATRLQSEELARHFHSEGPRLQVLVELAADDTSASGAKWSAATGRSVKLYSGLPCQARVIAREYPPANLVFPGLLTEKDKH